MSSEPRTADPTGSGSERRTVLGSIVHLVALFTGILGVGIVYIIADSAFTHENAQNALNWQIVFTGIYAIALVLAFVLGDVFVIIGALFALVGVFLDISFCLVATFKAVRGKAWQYPFAPTVV